MMKPLKVLLVEDNPDDAELIIRQLHQAGFTLDCHRVETERDYLTELARQPDIILSDYSLPQFNGLQAMELLRDSGRNIPFILISGTVGEDVAVTAMKHGATDYLLKDRVVRLGSAVERALREGRLRAEQRAALDALRASEERYRMLIEDARDAVFIVALDKTIVTLNHAFETLTGFSRADWLGREFMPLVHPEDLPRALNYFGRVTKELESTQVELRIRTHNGGVVTLEFTVSPQLRNGALVGVMGIGRDLSERRQLEHQLRQSQKMEAIGQLASGVAHDFNNILTVISGHAELLRISGELSGEDQDAAEQIAQATVRAANLTRQLLAFSRKQVIQPQVFDFNEVVGNLTKMLQRVLGEKVVLRLEYSARPALGYGDVGMMEQILMNLTINARDAMPQGGELLVSVSRKSLGEDAVQISSRLTPGEYAHLAVADTGTGIPPEILPRIFEPFFTTKDAGKGTGLGLATVYGIVQQHQGAITVESEVGRGTVFHLYLPLASVTAAEVAADTAPAADRGGTETILLVEDDATVRLLSRNVLARRGYTILEAQSAAEALEVWQTCGRPVHLVVADVMMPGNMDGHELVSGLQQRHPELRAIYTSGYSADILGRDFELRDGVNFLQKPYSPQQLLRTVRAALDQAPA